jgi:hypothetical protein
MIVLAIVAIGITITAADAIICVRIHALSHRCRKMAIVLSIHFVVRRQESLRMLVHI